jgi:hypothetical protein
MCTVTIKLEGKKGSEAIERIQRGEKVEGENT